MEAHVNRTLNLSRFLLVIAFLAMAYGCAHSRPSPTSSEIYGPPTEPAGPVGPPEAFGPPEPVAPPAYGPEPIEIRPLVLVLGPGIARDFAATGVLHALHDNNIPVAAIVATEFGSLVGGLYALDGNLNHLDWALMRFKNSLFVDDGGMFLKLLRPSDSEKLEQELNRAFGSKDLTQTKLPFRVVIQPNSPRPPIVADRGSMSQAIRAAMAVPGLFAPGEWDGAQAVAAENTLPFAVAEARAMNLGPVVVVNTLDKKDADKPDAETELKAADLVLEPDMSGIGYMDFQRRSEASFRGKVSVNQKITELRHLVGLPELEAPPNAPPNAPPETAKGGVQ